MSLNEKKIFKSRTGHLNFEPPNPDLINKISNSYSINE